MTEVLLRGTDDRFPEIQQVDQLSLFGGFAIGKFDCGGTGFVIKKEATKVIIATAAHIFLTDFKYNCFPKHFIIGGNSYLATPLKLSLDWSISNFYVDPISSIPISVPEDWILCELTPTGTCIDHLISLDVIDSSLLLAGDRVSSIGYIVNLTNDMIDYAAPSATSAEKFELMAKLFGVDQPIMFNGIVLESNEIICSSCSTLNGMSGCPLLVQNRGRYQVVGLLHGCRPSWLHHYASRILKDQDCPDIGLIQDLLRILSEKKKTMSSRGIIFVKGFIVLIEDFLKDTSCTDFLSITVNNLYKFASKIEEDSGNRVTYNVFIPSKFFQIV